MLNRLQTAPAYNLSEFLGQSQQSDIHDIPKVRKKLLIV